MQQPIHPMNQLSRKGVIDVSANLMDDADLPEILHRLRFVPFDVKYQVGKDLFRMLGTSPEFKELQPGEPTPYYTVVIKTEPGNRIASVSVHAET